MPDHIADPGGRSVAQSVAGRARDWVNRRFPVDPGVEQERTLHRWQMYREMDPVIRGLRLRGDALSISESKVMARWLDPADSRVTDTMFPDVDWSDLPYPDESFDVVLSDQVLEHVLDPQACIDESLRVLRPGGFLVCATCFMNGIHGDADNYRFTPSGLEYLCRTFSKIHASGGWGNRLAFLLITNQQLAYRLKVPDGNGAWAKLLQRVGSANNPYYPISTWVIAEK